jgi:hypothetical protein
MQKCATLHARSSPQFLKRRSSYDWLCYGILSILGPRMCESLSKIGSYKNCENYFGGLPNAVEYFDLRYAVTCSNFDLADFSDRQDFDL